MLKLKYIRFISIDTMMYGIQITSYWCKSLYFYGYILNLCDYSTHEITTNISFAFFFSQKNIEAYDSRSYVHRIQTLETFLSTIVIKNIIEEQFYYKIFTNWYNMLIWRPDGKCLKLRSM